MIVYGDVCENKNTVLCIGNLIQRTLEFDTRREHELATDLLIQFGTFEAGLTDYFCKDFDTFNPVIRELRRGGIMTSAACSPPHGNETSESLSGICWICSINYVPVRCPNPLWSKYPEGYAFYSLYPEFYYESALKFVRDVGPSHAVCIGIRSIGTSLSSVIVAALESTGCPATSFTVRPRGDYFDLGDTYIR